MKRSTVARHLREIADQADRLSRFDPDVFDIPPLVEVWVGGDLVDDGTEIEHVVAILVFDIDADELPEIVLHPVERDLHGFLGVGKRPMIWRSRPSSRPPWSHLERRVARIWTRDAGPDVDGIDGLARADFSGVTITAPTDDDLGAWLLSELPRSEDHLREVLDRYWDGDWRREHSGDGIYPDDHLWRASWAVQSMRDASAELA
jgi:hypothetical protein